MVKAKIEIIAGNEDNLMFSQANGKKAHRFLFDRVWMCMLEKQGGSTWHRI